MKNITVTVTNQAYRDARVWVAKRDMSLSGLVQHLIENLPGIPAANKVFELKDFFVSRTPSDQPAVSSQSAENSE